MSEDGEGQKRWEELAERITKEHDSDKLSELTEELCDALDEQLRSKKPEPTPKPERRQTTERSE